MPPPAIGSMFIAHAVEGEVDVAEDQGEGCEGRWGDSSRGGGRQAWRRNRGRGADLSEGGVAGYGGEVCEEDEVRDARGANPRGCPKVGKIKSKKSGAHELSSRSALVGQARTEMRPAAAASTAATRKATSRGLVWRGGRRRRRSCALRLGTSWRAARPRGRSRTACWADKVSRRGARRPPSGGVGGSRRARGGRRRARPPGRRRGRGPARQRRG